MKFTELNSNLIFLFPVLVSIIKGEAIYFTISSAILIASFLFHYHKNKNSPHTEAYRSLDIAIAVIAYLYLFYFISFRITIPHTPFYLALMMSLILFFIGKEKHNDPTVHTYFHLFIGTLSGIILLFG